jgi:hypothetical protein
MNTMNKYQASMQTDKLNLISTQNILHYEV